MLCFRMYQVIMRLREQGLLPRFHASKALLSDQRDRCSMAPGLLELFRDDTALQPFCLSLIARETSQAFSYP